ncbi:MAG: hypothetical protein EBR02_05450 [Alphaproteobacteria bacterium]|nr:hypothetical protein [Alphaproteobacteria bacterium]
MNHRYLEKNILEDLNEKMVFLGGPRQVGKTTLSRDILSHGGLPSIYLNWDNDQDRKAILTAHWPADPHQIIFDEITVGASSDIERATSLARKMVTEFGMSALGPISFDGHHGSYFLAKELGEGPLYSEETSARIDAEIKQIIDSSYKQAVKILKENRDILDEVTNRLLEKETIDSTEFNEILNKSS